MKKIADISLFESLCNNSCSVFNWDRKWDIQPPKTAEEWLDFVDPDRQLGWSADFVMGIVNRCREKRYMTTDEIMKELERVALIDSNLEYYMSHGLLGDKFNSLFGIGKDELL
jgi:hypothetical protein